jgi:inosine-uridine nucleoside N-ribohydrolase
MAKKLIIDTDPGVDDSMAILFAFNSPEIEVVGLTTIFGNVTTELATQNALRLVEFAGHPEVPVAHGADKPLSVPLDSIADFVHGTDGLGNTNQPPPKGKAINKPAAQFIVETIMANPGEITLVPVGPLTNIALALLLEPRIVENVAEVVIMGGAALMNGNVNPAAEANIFHDPHAADMVFTANWPVTMVGLDVTTKTTMTEAYLAAIRDNGGRTAKFIWEISRFYEDFHYQMTKERAIHTHDPSAIAYVIDPTLFKTIRGPIRVVTEGVAIGLTLLDRWGLWYGTHEWSNKPAVNVCVEVDSERLLALYKARIVAAP